MGLSQCFPDNVVGVIILSCAEGGIRQYSKKKKKKQEFHDQVQISLGNARLNRV